jgi:hypothetical protein
LDKKVTVLGKVVTRRTLALAGGALVLLVMLYFFLGHSSLGALFVPSGAKLAVQEYVAQNLPQGDNNGYTIQSDGWQITGGEKAPDPQALQQPGNIDPFVNGPVDEAWCVTISPAVTAQADPSAYSMNPSATITGFVVARDGDNWAVAVSAGNGLPPYIAAFQTVGCSGVNVATF